MRGCSSPFGARAANFTPVPIQHLSGGPPLPSQRFLPFGLAVQAGGKLSRRYCALSFPLSARRRGLITRPAHQCVSCFPQVPQPWLDFSKVRTEALGRVPAHPRRSGRSSASSTPSRNVGKGKASGKKNGLTALFGCVRATHTPVCGLSGGFAEPGVLNASEVLPGCKKCPRGCTRVSIGAAHHPRL